MNFEKDLRHMRDSYFELERQFIEISRIIPLDNPSDTYSPRLYDILQTSCGQVENLLRLICDKLELESGQNSHFLDLAIKIHIVIPKKIKYFLITKDRLKKVNKIKMFFYQDLLKQFFIKHIVRSLL